jgi:nucleoside-diphosphate-sugar epimerase
MNRRQIVRAALWSAAVSATSGAPRIAFADTRPKRILVLGGTNFLGPAFVESAVGAGHSLTLFNRGVTNPGLFSHIPQLRGFRDPLPSEQNLSALGTRTWDAVIDVWPHDPALVASAAERLKDRTDHYLYVSSISAYAATMLAKPGITEDADLAPWASAESAYGRGKAESERRLQQIIGGKLTIVRPGAIKGVRDDTPDLFDWLRRLQRGGPHIAPGDGGDPVQIVDVKDVARFLVLAIDQALFGAFNLTGRPYTFRRFLAECQSAVHANDELVWIPGDFLHANGLDAAEPIANWNRSFPYWRPDRARRGFSQMSSEKAFAAGWMTRPLRETALDCLDDFAMLEHFEWRDTLAPDKEAEVLNLWAARNSHRASSAG